MDTAALFDDHLEPTVGRELVTARQSPPRHDGPTVQRSLDDLGLPLHQVTFCVLDLETTGGNRTDDQITEIGAVKLRGGESLGTFQTMVNPGIRIPAEITVLTGITEAMVMRAPRVEQVLPTFLEFLGDAVIVGHNVSFDMAFLNNALQRSGRPTLGNHVVDTLAVARRTIVDEVPNLRLGTLADRLRLDHKPSHRALDDALATGDLLHVLLERAACFGVLGLDDLLAMPKLDNHPQAHKLALTDDLPRRPGVYQFHDRDGRVLYVGKATNLRTRVRSYFSGDRRKKIAQLLRETDHISHVECPGPLEPEVTEIRLIQQHTPRFNRVAKSPQKYVYIKLTLNERFPRLSIVTRPKPDGALYLGPVSSRRTAAAAVDAIHSVTQLRRCTSRPSARSDCGPCATAQLGASACPCTGYTPVEKYDDITNSVVRELTVMPEQLLGRLAAKMDSLAGSERFEEAADIRDRAAALANVLHRQRLFRQLRRAERIEFELPERGGAELRRGRLVRTWSSSGVAPLFADATGAGAGLEPRTDGTDSWVERCEADELVCVASWLENNAADISLRLVEGEWASPATVIPRFAARKGAIRRTDR